MLLRSIAALLLASTATASLAAGANIDPKRLSDHIKILASDDFEGRGPATAGEDKTVTYISQQLKAAGLQPGGENGGWTQAVTLERFTASDIRTSLTENGKAVPLAFPDQAVVNTRRTGSTHVSLKDAPIVFVGYGVKAPEQGWDDFKGVDLKGKVALVLVNDPDFETAPGKFGGKAMTYYGRWTYKFEELARQGATGVILVHEREPASYGWEVIKSGWVQPLFDIPRPAAERAPFEGWVQRDIAVALFKSAGLDFESEKKKAQSESFRPVALKGATFSTDFAVKAEKIVTRNVLGKLAGTTRPNEYVLFGGHWDHLGVGEPDAKGDRIFNGALDNASGIAAIIELARAFKAAPPTQRSLVFMAFTAEEKGLLGSEYYAQHPIYPLAKTVAVFNIDGLSINGRTRDISVGGQGKLEMEDDLVRLAKAQGRTLSPEAHPESGGYYRSDHFPFAKVGVPALDFGGGQDLVNGGKAAGEKAGRDFNRDFYHQQGDEWHAETDYSGAVQNLDLTYSLARELADSGKWTGWKAGAEFKPIRDKTAAERR